MDGKYLRARDTVCQHAHRCSRREGGWSIMQELPELIMTAQNNYDEILAPYFELPTGQPPA